jgi:hypothetical protein
MDKIKNFFTKRSLVPAWAWYLILACLWGRIAVDIYDWWTWDRIVDVCLEQKLYRCEVGEHTLFITYGDDAGPDR